MNKCNGKCSTLAIIKTTNGYKFGDYTTQIWKEGELKIIMYLFFRLIIKKNIILNNQNMLLVLIKIIFGYLVGHMLEMKLVIFKRNMN